MNQPLSSPFLQTRTRTKKNKPRTIVYTTEGADKIMYTINSEPECLPADKNAEGVVKPEPQARLLPLFQRKTNAFHFQKVAIFLCRKSVERECRWKGGERNQALFQNLKSETCKQKFVTTLVRGRRQLPAFCFKRTMFV